jgi:hypothetical protein
VVGDTRSPAQPASTSTHRPPSPLPVVSHWTSYRPRTRRGICCSRSRPPGIGEFRAEELGVAGVVVEEDLQSGDQNAHLVALGMRAVEVVGRRSTPDPEEPRQQLRAAGDVEFIGAVGVDADHDEAETRPATAPTTLPPWGTSPCTRRDRHRSPRARGGVRGVVDRRIVEATAGFHAAPGGGERAVVGSRTGGRGGPRW